MDFLLLCIGFSLLADATSILNQLCDTLADRNFRAWLSCNLQVSLTREYSTQWSIIVSLFWVIGQAGFTRLHSAMQCSNEATIYKLESWLNMKQVYPFLSKRNSFLSAHLFFFSPVSSSFPSSPCKRKESVGNMQI